jgi:hypothetical protein
LGAVMSWWAIDAGHWFRGPVREISMWEIPDEEQWSQVPWWSQCNFREFCYAAKVVIIHREDALREIWMGEIPDLKQWSQVPQ